MCEVIMDLSNEIVETAEVLAEKYDTTPATIVAMGVELLSEVELNG
jgi:hypothetical protein